MLQKTSRYYLAGSVGAFINSMTVWLFGASGISAALSVSIQPKIEPSWLYPRLVWGGLWGLSYFLIKGKFKNRTLEAFVFSLPPTLVQLFLVFPYKAHKGFLGAELGNLTWALVILFNLIWALMTLFLIKRGTSAR